MKLRTDCNLWNQLTSALVILTTVISSIGLLVGGIGVMNIMLISVTERTQEIGVRKAIGARRADIRLQFLLEAVVLTLVGGTIGILIGSGISTLVRTFVPSIPATLSYLWVSVGFAISVGVGLFFGYYPANVAANLDPIDCLRYEQIIALNSKSKRRVIGSPFSQNPRVVPKRFGVANSLTKR